MVVELDDVVPRRDKRKPNLYVAKTLTVPDKRYEVIKRTMNNRWYSGHVIRLRSDLAPARVFRSDSEVKIAYSELVKKLSREGFTVNRNTQVWTVYVIELDKNAVTDPGKGVVYVGQTSRTPEERLRQHLDADRNSNGRLYSGVVRKYGVKLRPDLAPHAKYFDAESAKQAEKEHFELLKSRGYSVRGGH